MEHHLRKARTNTIGSIQWIAAVLMFVALINCAHQPPQLTVSQYRFMLNQEDYRIRSIQSSEKSHSYNELIGDRFLAVDYDQDGILETVVLGEASLSEAQQVYEYGLNSLLLANKLKVRSSDFSHYAQQKEYLQFEIRSFRPKNAQPFNQFRITNIRTLVPAEVLVFLDQNADGVLDKALKEEVTLDKYQPQYEEIIRSGLQQGALIKMNGMVLVKEK